jgi:hypothetical protein
MDQKDPSDPSGHITGLTFHSVKCSQINIPDEVVLINIETVDVGFKDSVKKHSISLKCNNVTLRLVKQTIILPIGDIYTKKSLKRS